MDTASEGTGHRRGSTAKTVLGKIDEIEGAYERGELSIGPRDAYLDKREDIRKTLNTVYSTETGNRVARLLDQSAFEHAREEIYDLITGERI
ncbi:MAG: hypothetical protein ABEJ72_11105 [Candidatus Aenigmatarchaeota archaeon]